MVSCMCTARPERVSRVQLQYGAITSHSLPSPPPPPPPPGLALNLDLPALKQRSVLISILEDYVLKDVSGGVGVWKGYIYDYIEVMEGGREGS